MSNICYACGSEIPPVSQSYQVEYKGEKVDLCYKCFTESKKYGSPEQVISTQLRIRGMAGGDSEKLDEEKQKLVDSIILTTASEIEGKRVIEYKGIIGAQYIAGINIFKDILAGLSNIVGGRSETLQGKMREMRNAVLSELKNEALLKDANAVIAIKIDFDEYSEGMLMLSATGTAVKVS